MLRIGSRPCVTHSWVTNGQNENRRNRFRMPRHAILAENHADAHDAVGALGQRKRGSRGGRSGDGLARYGGMTIDTNNIQTANHNT